MTNSEIVNKHLAELGEHFDSVRIFVTKHDGNDSKTLNLTSGLGNIYAQIGQVNEWKAQQDEIGRKEISD